MLWPDVMCVLCYCVVVCFRHHFLLRTFIVFTSYSFLSSSLHFVNYFYFFFCSFLEAWCVLKVRNIPRNILRNIPRNILRNIFRNILMKFLGAFMINQFILFCFALFTFILFYLPFM